MEPLRKVVELRPHLRKQLAVVGGFDFRKAVGLSRCKIPKRAEVRRARSR